MKNLYLLIALICMGCKVSGQVFSAPVGIATVVTPGEYNLTPASMCGGGHKGAFWCTTTIDFSVSFVLTFQASFDQAVPPGADGMAVVFGQYITPASVNSTDAYLGYYNIIGGPADPDFNNSFGVEFDIFDNSFNPYFDDIPGTDHTAICLNALPTTPVTGPIAISPSTTNVKDGAFHDYKITWCPLTHTLQVFYNDTLRLSSVYDYASVFTTPTAVGWGFSGGTGAACSNQLIKNINLVTGSFCAPPLPCQVNSLVINTGYDPVSGLAVTGGANGATPVPDPKWKLSAVTPGVASAIAATSLTGLVEVLPGNQADVITQAVGWLTPSSPLSGWISCLNSNYYYTDGTGVTAYNMTLGRPFKLCSSDSITIDCYIANDNYITSSDMDGVPLLISQPPSILASNYSMYTHFTQTVYLSAGAHTLNITASNFNVSYPAINPTGLTIYGTVSSTTGTSSILSETDSTCTCPVVVTTCDSLSMPDSIALCKNATYTIPASLSGTNSVLSMLWTPSSGLSSSTVLNPVVTANSSGWYALTVQSITNDNLVVNGDFSAGNTGFSSTYPYVSGPGSLVPAGVYAITTNPHMEHPGAASFADHTSGTGNMMAINGASSPIDVWCETLPVTPNTWYDFSSWFANWSSDTATNLPIIQFKINGTLIGPAFSFPHADGVWTQFFTTWYSGSSTSAGICINDQQTAASGNDFAIDDISFQPVCTATDSIYILVKAPDSLYESNDTSICSTEGSMLLVAPDGNSWLWSLGSSTQGIAVNLSGTYWVNISRGCDSFLSDTFHVAINPVPVVTLRTDTSVCQGIQIILGSPEPAGVSYSWSNGSTDSSISVSAAGTYLLKVTDQGCTGSGSMILTTIPKPDPVFLGPDTVLCKGEEITLTTNDAYTFWSNGQNGKSIVVTSAGLYYATVSNQCGITSDSINVAIEPCDLWFPSAFTPNGDNLNDYARVVGDLKMIRNFSLSIYNRWGERVFHTTDIYSGWDGEYNGVKQGLGTFFYMINYTLQGKSHLLKGDLSLIR